jgi:multidrug efflux pump subunit AcrA (membrane-fusion protein)
MFQKIFFFLFVVFIFSSCSLQAETPSSSQKEVFSLIPQETFPFLEISGEIIPHRETTVSAKTGGRIAELSAEIGDFVLKDTLLGKLAGDETVVNAETSRVNEKNIQNAFEAQKIFLEEQVQSARKALETAQSHLQATKTNTVQTKNTTQEQESLAQKNKEQAEVFLENTKKTAEQRLHTVYGSSVSAIRMALLVVTNVNTFSDTILGVSEAKKNLNDDFEDNLSALNNTLKRETENILLDALKQREELKTLYDEKIEFQSLTPLEHKEYLQKALQNLEHSQLLLKKMYDVFNNSVSSTNLSENQIHTWKQENLLLSQQTEEALLSLKNGQKTGVKGILLSLEEIETQNAGEISQAESAVNTVTQNLLQIQTSHVQNVSQTLSQKEIAEKQVKQAESALKSAQAQKESALKSLQTQIDLAKGNTLLSQVAFKNTHIGAPFSGVITEKIGEVGQVIGAGQPVYRIADTSLLKVLVDVPDTEISKIFVGGKAEIKIDGFQTVFTGNITKIYPQINPLTRRVNIEITLDTQVENTRIGSFVHGKIFLSPEQSFFVPEDFIFYTETGAFVYLDDMKKQDIDIAFFLENTRKIWWDGIASDIKIYKP